VGRPAVADALVSAGRAATRSEAFDLWLGEGRPAFVPRRGAGAREVIDVIHDAGGLASIAHPGLLQMDDLVEALTASGLDAIEACHSEHDAETEAYYRDMAMRLGVAVSGGSDFHGEAGRARELGEVVLSARDFEILSQRAGARARS
jgi:predicted metal-dependent phosphoesterase TrpH